MCNSRPPCMYPPGGPPYPRPMPIPPPGGGGPGGSPYGPAGPPTGTPGPAGRKAWPGTNCGGPAPGGGGGAPGTKDGAPPDPGAGGREGTIPCIAAPVAVDAPAPFYVLPFRGKRVPVWSFRHVCDPVAGRQGVECKGSVRIDKKNDTRPRAEALVETHRRAATCPVRVRPASCTAGVRGSRTPRPRVRNRGRTPRPGGTSSVPECLGRR